MATEYKRKYELEKDNLPQQIHLAVYVDFILDFNEDEYAFENILPNIKGPNLALCYLSLEEHEFITIVEKTTPMLSEYQRKNILENLGVHQHWKDAINKCF